jgi:hypothetical protein
MDQFPRLARGHVRGGWAGTDRRTSIEDHVMPVGRDEVIRDLVEFWGVTPAVGRAMATLAERWGMTDEDLAGVRGSLSDKSGVDHSEIERLRYACAEFYQVIAALADTAGLFDDAEVTKALDNAWAAASGDPLPHSDLLPFSAGKKDGKAR